MAKKEPLNTMEKYAIDKMVEEGMTENEIAKLIPGRGITAIKSYIQTAFPGEIENRRIPQRIRTRLLKELIKNGVEEKSARESINILDGKLKEDITDFTDEKFNLLYAACLKQQSARESFKTKTEGGDEGVTVMTQAASFHADDARAKRNENIIHRRDCIFQPRG